MVQINIHIYFMSSTISACHLSFMKTIPVQALRVNKWQRLDPNHRNGPMAVHTEVGMNRTESIGEHKCPQEQSSAPPITSQKCLSLELWQRERKYSQAPAPTGPVLICILCFYIEFNKPSTQFSAHALFVKTIMFKTNSSSYDERAHRIDLSSLC